MRKVFLILTSLFFLASCSSVPVVELPKVQRSLAEKLVSSEANVQKASTDYREKKALYDNLAKINSTSFKEAEKDLGAFLRRMFDHLNDVNAARKSMSEASGDVASLSYQRSKIYGDDKAYPLVADAVKRFEDAQNKLQQSLLDYSRESNSMADLVQAKKLFFTFDVMEFQKRVQKSVNGMQEKEKIMQRDLLRAENTVNEWSSEESRADLNAAFDEMRTIAGDYGNSAQKLNNIAVDMQGVTNSQAKVTSFDPNWAQIQKLIADAERAIAEIPKIEDKFSKSAEKFRKLSKRG